MLENCSSAKAFSVNAPNCKGTKRLKKLSHWLFSKGTQFTNGSR